MTRLDVPNGPTYLSQPMFRKFVDTDVLTLVEGSDFRYADNNTILYRFADALLIYAEAQNEADGAPNNDAYKAVNDIRNRAGLDDLTPNLSQEDFRLAVWQERRVELAGEYKRKFDLIRTDRLTNSTFPINIVWEAEQGSVRSLNAVSNDFSGNIQWPDNEWLWPIPQAQMEINLKYGWKQNEGYE